MLKIYVVVALLTSFNTNYSMEKEPAKSEYLEDARQLSGEKNLYFSLLPQDVLGIVQHYRLNEPLDRALESQTYSEALASIQKLAQLPEYGQVFNDPKFIDSLIQKISSRFGKAPEQVAQDINTLGAQLWFRQIRPAQLRLLDAALVGDLSLVPQLIAQGVNVNALDIAGNTALMGFATRGYTEVVKELIDAGANVNAKNHAGSTALLLAANRGHATIVKMLIAADADVNAQDGNGMTALIHAAERDHAKAVKELIAARADVNSQDKYGRTALIYAAHYRDTEIVKELIKARADVNSRDKYGMTALMVAAYNGYTEAVKIFIAAKADVNAQDQYGWTALMNATQRGYAQVVKELISAGVNGNAALDLARQQNNKDIIELLEKATKK